MRPIPLMSAAMMLALVAPAVAQDEWDEFASKEDGFSVNFPGPPTVEPTTWTTQYGYTAPARIYRANHGQERYSVTVVDYRTLEQQGIERAKQCPPGAEPCRGNQVGSLGAGYWRMDVRGALIYSNAWHGLGDYPVPPLAGRGGGGGAGAGAGGGRGTAGRGRLEGSGSRITETASSATDCTRDSAPPRPQIGIARLSEGAQSGARDAVSRVARGCRQRVSVVGSPRRSRPAVTREKARCVERRRSADA